MFHSLASLYKIFLTSSGVVIDSRAVAKGSLFFALKGEKADGNEFALQSLEKGAIGAVIDNPLYKDNPGCIYVEDSLKTLQELAKFHRNTFDFPVIGLTGSNGKTTTKELVMSVLKCRYNIQATKGNLNNHIGVPLTILNVRKKLDFLIVEMGANHQGEIDFLCHICQPDYGFITNIGKAHLEGFGGIEGVKKGKSELYRYIAKHGGTLFVNGEDEILCSLLPPRPDQKVIKYYPSVYKTTPSDVNFLSFGLDGISYSTHLVGDYNISNIAIAFQVGLYFDVNPEDITEALQNYEPSNHRSQLIKYKGMNIVMDAYNANPSSMRVSIQNFANSAAANKVLVLGDMFELGEYTNQEHTDLISFVNQFSWNKVIFVGNHFLQCKIEKPNYFFFGNTEQVKDLFHSLEHTDCYLLLKGSRGIALEKLLE